MKISERLNEFHLALSVFFFSLDKTNLCVDLSVNNDSFLL